MRQRKVCRGCGKKLHRRNDEFPYLFALRKHCDSACVGLAQRLDIERDGCESCGGTMVRRSGETNADFTRRKHCSARCVLEFQRRESAHTTVLGLALLDVEISTLMDCARSTVRMRRYSGRDLLTGRRAA